MGFLGTASALVSWGAPQSVPSTDAHCQGAASVCAGNCLCAQHRELHTTSQQRSVSRHSWLSDHTYDVWGEQQLEWGNSFSLPGNGLTVFWRMRHTCTRRPFFPCRQGEHREPTHVLCHDPQVCATTQKSPPLLREAQLCARCSSLFSSPPASQQSCAGIQVSPCSMQHRGHGVRSTPGQTQSLCSFSYRADSSCSSPAPRGDQRDFLNRFLIPPQLYPSNTSLRLEMRRLAHLLHRKPEASYILLSRQLAPLVRTHSIKERATISTRRLCPPRPGVNASVRVSEQWTQQWSKGRSCWQLGDQGNKKRVALFPAAKMLYAQSHSAEGPRALSGCLNKVSKKTLQGQNVHSEQNWKKYNSSHDPPSNSIKLQCNYSKWAIPVKK